MKKIIRKIINHLGYDIIKPKRSQLTIQNIFASYFYKIPEDFFFVQVGAHDGKTRDPLYDYITRCNLAGILVEPQRVVFEKLQQNYASCKNLIFANIAIAEMDGYRSLYGVKESFQSTYNQHIDKGDDATGIASFSKDHIRTHLKKNMPRFFKEKNIDDYIGAETVKTLSFDTFTQKYNVKKIDLLQIDAEGFDFKIIKMLDFSKFSPSFINYESKNLQKIDRDRCEKLLQSKGYVLIKPGGDTCALKVRKDMS